MSFTDECNGVVWNRSGACTEPEEDVWDDRALINAYDRAVRKVNQRIADKSDSNERTNNTNNNNNNDWHLGQYCRTVYSEDGIEYEAQIISIDTQNNTCFVKYVGYGNEEQKSLNDLKPSLGKRTRRMQSQLFQTQDINNSNNCESDHDLNRFTNNKTTNQFKQNKPSTSSWFMPSSTTTDPKPSSQPIVPPPLPFTQDFHTPDDDESLASMLMSWYMSGYHTGYYRALKQFKLNCKCNK